MSRVARHDGGPSRTHGMSGAIMNATGCFLRSVHPHWDNRIGRGGIELCVAEWRTQCEFVPGDANRSGQKLDAACLSMLRFFLRHNPTGNTVANSVLAWQGVLIVGLSAVAVHQKHRRTASYICLPGLAN